MKRVGLKFALVAALTLAGPAMAAKPIKAGALAVDPALAYVLVRLGPIDGHGQIVTLQRYELQHGTAVLYPGKGDPMSKKELDIAAVAGGNVFANGPVSRTYLMPVHPGQWLIASAGATCFSLGTYGFEAKAGEVVDIGTILIGREDGKSTVPEIAAAKLSPDLAEFGTMINIIMSDAMLVRPASDADAVPANLGGMAVRRAALVADVRYADTCQTMINRAIGLPKPAHHDVTAD